MIINGDQPTHSGMGRKLRYPDKIIAPLPPGSLKRIEALLMDAEDKTDFLRAAVHREIERREAGGVASRDRLKLSLP